MSQLGDEFSISLSAKFLNPTRFVLEFSGEMKKYELSSSNNSWTETWLQFKSQCDYYDRCGEFSICHPDRPVMCQCSTGFEGGASGCVPKRPVDCGDGNSTGAARSGWRSGNFETLPRMKPPDHGTLRQSILNEKGCRQLCVSNVRASRMRSRRIWVAWCGPGNWSIFSGSPVPPTEAASILDWTPPATKVPPPLYVYTFPHSDHSALSLRFSLTPVLQSFTEN